MIQDLESIFIVGSLHVCEHKLCSLALVKCHI